MCIIPHQLIRPNSVGSVYLMINVPDIRAFLCKNLELSTFILHILTSLCILILKNSCIFYLRKNEYEKCATVTRSQVHESRLMADCYMPAPLCAPVRLQLPSP